MVWLCEACTQNVPYLSTVTTQHKTRQRRVRRLLLTVRKCVGTQARNARFTDGQGVKACMHVRRAI